MRKLLLLVFIALFILLTACGSTEEKNHGLSDAQLNQEETVTHEEVAALNEYDGEVIEVNKTDEMFGFSINVHNYYVTDKIYSRTGDGYLETITPDNDKEFIVMYLEVTNNSGEESVIPYLFNVVTDNQIVRYVDRVGDDSFTKNFGSLGLFSDQLIDGGKSEGYFAIEVPKDSNNLALRIEQSCFCENPDTVDIPL